MNVTYLGLRYMLVGFPIKPYIYDLLLVIWVSIFSLDVISLHM